MRSLVLTCILMSILLGCFLVSGEVDVYHFFKKTIITFAALCMAHLASAGVTITGTRIIFPSNQNQVTVQLNNPDQHPALIQAWLDNGDPNTIPAANKVPFILNPPLVRIEANKGQMLRLVAKDVSQLPKDRESLYWFNILDIAPSDAKIPNKLNISIRSRIKLFYRPSNLIAPTETAFKQLTFTHLANTQKVEVNNPTPYFISFSDITVNPKQQAEVYSDPFMISPFSKANFPIKTIHAKDLKYGVINDYGGTQSFDYTLQ